METISGLLSMQKALSQRKAQLESVKSSCTSLTRYGIGENQRTEEPTYDIKEVDKKIVKINNSLFQIDKKIKDVNARTEVSIDINFDDLMSGL